MSNKPVENSLLVEPVREPALEQFLIAVEQKTTDPIHLRLLKACRQDNPVSTLEAELRAIFDEIIYAD